MRERKHVVAVAVGQSGTDMPASWLVTKPPEAEQQKRDDRRHHGKPVQPRIVILRIGVHIKKRQNPGSRAGVAEILFDFKGEIHGHVAVLHFHVLRL